MQQVKKSANKTSEIGRMPVMAAPTAPPINPFSDFSMRIVRYKRLNGINRR
jgi:hypothetical protein